MKASLALSVVMLVSLQKAALAQVRWTQGQSITFGQFGQAMAHDTARNRVVLFGYAAATWELNGDSWLQLTPATSPMSTEGHRMVYDSVRQRVVLFGGRATSGVTSYGDTWEWDGNSWTFRSGGGPSPRSNHSMAYDSARQRTVLFGGWTTSALLGDTWEWDGSSWLQRSPAANPPPRQGHAMAYDAARQRVILFGGNVADSDTWEWNGVYWAAVFSSTFPAGRRQHALAYDSLAQRVVLFGGVAPGGLLGDTWTLEGAEWRHIPTLTAPSSRYGHAMVYDSAVGRCVLVGGHNGFALSDTWTMPSFGASATTFGAGCGQPPLDFAPDVAAPPLLGQVASATIVGAPTPAAFVSIGSNNQAYGPFSLPVTLASIGMLGCDLYQSADVLGLATNSISQTARSFALPIPNSQSLIGLHVYMQAYAFAPGVNPLNVIISNAIDWRLGDS
jgi:hypothetical protein